ncbi:rRNA-processing protein UTP23-like protein [Pyrus ussuriensis x Pyrus communis]|uniref:rRNA-processing protein UTP23-like protein n=1 Tax=Pyrus ussuriensis x Pyrus communis TaxID=2448454 RepID=A0A5N5G940_9ROSA|nr:rRNA-processing protein UTP23-like protein [Pyrus ussuriensis x Pyrus communis]
MRVKRQKRHRKSVRFYTACYGFRQPYKVLCDVTFVHHLVTNRITPADKAISNVLGAPVLLFTTKCALAELKQHGSMLGPSYSQSLEAANSLIIARCDHESPASAEDCILDVVGQSNSEHFFVATQHVDLRQKLLKIPGVPAIYALRTAILLESPSDAQRQFVKSSKEQRLHMTELEYKMLKKKKNILNSHEKDDPSGEEDAKRDTARKGLGVKDKVQFKRKRAKGPNPLSCKKKKMKNTDRHSLQERKDGDATLRSRKKRSRSWKGKKTLEADG